MCRRHVTNPRKVLKLTNLFGVVLELEVDTSTVSISFPMGQNEYSGKYHFKYVEYSVKFPFAPELEMERMYVIFLAPFLRYIWFPVLPFIRTRLRLWFF